LERGANHLHMVPADATATPSLEYMNILYISGASEVSEPRLSSNECWWCFI